MLNLSTALLCRTTSKHGGMEPLATPLSQPLKGWGVEAEQLPENTNTMIKRIEFFIIINIRIHKYMEYLWYH